MNRLDILLLLTLRSSFFVRIQVWLVLMRGRPRWISLKSSDRSSFWKQMTTFLITFTIPPRLPSFQRCLFRLNTVVLHKAALILILKKTLYKVSKNSKNFQGLCIRLFSAPFCPLLCHFIEDELCGRLH